MRAITELFTINGQGILVPDAPVTTKTTDVEGESARDRSGMLHRTVLRQVRTWEFTYRQLTEQERQYMLALLTQGAFPFTHPGGQTVCYCKGHAMDYQDAQKGLWRNFRFQIEEA
jgi:hypothetical protein